MGVEGVDATVVHDDDAVGVLHGHDPLRDDDLGRLRDVLREALPDAGLGRGVDRARGVVEDEDFRVFQQGSRDAQSLLLTAGHVGAALFDVRLVALRHLPDELVSAGDLAGADAFFFRGVLLAPAKVFDEGAGEQFVFLKDHRHFVAQRLQVIFLDVVAADIDRAVGLFGPFRGRVRVVEAADEAHERRLAAAGTADDADGLTGADVEVDVVKVFLSFAVFLVGEMDVVETDAAVRDFIKRVFRVHDVRFLDEDFGNTVGRSGTHGQHDQDGREHHQREHGAHDIAEEGREGTGGHGAFDDEVRTEPADADHDRVDGEHHTGHHDDHPFFRLDEQVVQVEGGFHELLVFVVFPDEGLDDADGGNILLDARVEVIVPFEDFPEQAHDLHAEGGGNDGDEHQNAQKHQRDLFIDDEAHHQREDEHQRRADRDAEDHLERVLHVRDVGRHAGDEAGRAELVDVREGVGLDLLVHRPSQVPGKAGGRERAEPARCHAEQKAQECHTEHGHAVFHDIAHVSLADAPVDDHGGHVRNEDLHNDFEGREERGERGRRFVVADFPQHRCIFHWLHALSKGRKPAGPQPAEYQLLWLSRVSAMKYLGLCLVSR